MVYLKRFHKLILTLAIPILVSPIFLWTGYKRESSGSQDPISFKQPHGFFVIIVMTLYWITECIPLAVTSFVPVVLFPLFGILSSEAVTREFLKDTILFLLGGCVIALSFEYCQLHTRIALRVILSVGARIPNLLLGIMATAMILSMWMNNTSCTSMMIPIVNVIMEEFKKTMDCDAICESSLLDDVNQIEMTSRLRRQRILRRKKKAPLASPEDGNNIDAGMIKPSSDTIDCTSNEITHQQTKNQLLEIVLPTYEEVSKRFPSNFHNDAAKINRRVTSQSEVRNIKIMFLVATAYAANIGGTGVITGTGTNLIATAQLDLKREEIKEKRENYVDPHGCLEGEFLKITFLGWMYFAMIPMILNTLICWLYLQVHFLGLPHRLQFWKKKIGGSEKLSLDSAVAKNIEIAIRQKYDSLGPMKFDEKAVLMIFLVTAALWIFRDPQIFPGWGKLFSNSSFLKDATPTLLMSSFLFVIPRDIKYYKNFLDGGFAEGIKDPLVTWQFVVKKLPWGPFLLLGGGSAMAAGSKASGLNDVIGDFLGQNEFIKSANPSSILLIALGMISLFTSVASNTATAAIVSPLLISLAISRSIHPLYLLMPMTISSSYAFILPVSTPPLAIVYDQSEMRQSEMIKAGILTTIFSNLVLFACTNSILEVFFHFNSYNGTCNTIET